MPSPKVKTYDLKPEMSAGEVTDKLIEAIGSALRPYRRQHANTDQVGHSGDHAAAVKAVEAVDVCLSRLMAAVEMAGGVLLVTADHGNAELMFDETTHPAHPAHLNRVPALLFNAPANIRSLADGKLADVAPTMLALMADQPREMTAIHCRSRRGRSSPAARPVVVPDRRGAAIHSPRAALGVSAHMTRSAWTP